VAAAPQDKDKWPFDPMQPGDREPVRIPDEAPSKKDPSS
jgi:hypothetical protein